MRLPVFCDWLTLSFRAKNLSTAYDRQIQCREGEQLAWSRPAWTDVRDPRQQDDRTKSDSTNIRVRWNPETEQMRISGNLGRWGRRDNVFGSSVWASAWRFLDFLQDTERLEILSEPELSRVDLTANIAFANAIEAYQYVSWASGIKLSRGSNPMQYPTGVSWVTENWSAKIYDKIADLKRLNNQELAAQLQAEYGYLMRLEITLRTDEINKYDLTRLSAWPERTDIMTVIFSDKFKPLLRPGYTVDELIEEMPTRLMMALQAYRNGTNYPAQVTAGRMNVRTYQRLRKALLAYGVDISQPPNVTRMHIKPRDVTYQFVEAPEWYRERVA